jgi:hypothetical protein
MWVMKAHADDHLLGQKVFDGAVAVDVVLVVVRARETDPVPLLMDCYPCCASWVPVLAPPRMNDGMACEISVRWRREVLSRVD